MSLEHNEQLLLFILLVHYVLDFGMQTNWQAQNKSVSYTALGWHVTVYTVLWGLFLLTLGTTLEQVSIFCMVTFVSHYVTDAYTSRLGKPFWDGKDYHNGFKMVGWDQILHYIQLYYTFKLIGLL